MAIFEEVGDDIIHNDLFLEFYGSLIGDGWLGRYRNKNKVTHIVGLSGHAQHDLEYMKYLKKIILKLFGRDISIKKKQKNAIELYFAHKVLVSFFNEKLDFPIGKKTDEIRICDKVICLGDNKLKHVIKGIFDTDGSFFMDKVYGYSYPNIEINMNAPLLLDQIEEFLKRNKFKPQRKTLKIRLKGIRQVNQWMKMIGTNNPKHFNKYKNWLNHYARVA